MKLSIFKWGALMEAPQKKTKKADADEPIVYDDGVAAKVQQIAEGIKWLNENCAETIYFEWDRDLYATYGLTVLPLQQPGLCLSLRRSLTVKVLV